MRRDEAHSATSANAIIITERTVQIMYLDLDFYHAYTHVQKCTACAKYFCMSHALSLHECMLRACQDPKKHD